MTAAARARAIGLRGIARRCTQGNPSRPLTSVWAARATTPEAATLLDEAPAGSLLSCRLPPHTASLHTIFNGGNLATNGALAEWRALSGYGYQQNCNRQGFNIQNQNAYGGVNGNATHASACTLTSRTTAARPIRAVLWAARPYPLLSAVRQAALAARAVA